MMALIITKSQHTIWIASYRTLSLLVAFLASLELMLSTHGYLVPSVLLIERSRMELAYQIPFLTYNTTTCILAGVQMPGKTAAQILHDFYDTQAPDSAVLVGLFSFLHMPGRLLSFVLPSKVSTHIWRSWTTDESFARRCLGHLVRQ